MTTRLATAAADSALVQSLHASYGEHYGPVEQEQRITALHDLDELAFPTSKTEFWKYTRVNRLLKLDVAFQPDVRAEDAPAIEGLNAVRIHIRSGHAAQNTELPEGVEFKILGASAELPEPFGALAQPKHHVMEAVNTAFCPEILVLRIAANKKIEDVIELSFTASNGSVYQPRVLIEAGAGSSATVLMRYSSPNAATGFTNSLSEMHVGANARLNVFKMEHEGDQWFHHSADYARLSDGAHFEIVTAPESGGWTRNNLNIRLDGKQAFARLNGLYLLEGNRHLDNNTFVDHAVPHCDSSELYKGVLYDESTAVFNGKVIVRPDAQKTNAFQQNNNLVLSENAQQFSKPELEIYADDVKCSHGSTTGQMDEEAVFYLQSRAIDKTEATRMLVAAFAAEVIDEVENEAIRSYFYDKFTQ